MGLPAVSVVIPTYNRSALLRRTLESLTRQSVAVDEFEVIVADDGSGDDTRAVVDEFGERLRMRYVFQEDAGFRAAKARNEGARLSTAPVLVFLDTGLLVGPGFVQVHSEAHAIGAARAVIGYTYGYNRFDPFPGLAELIDGLTAQQAVDRLGEDPRFHDMRHERFAGVDFELDRLVAPWWLFWSLNISMTADDFRAIGGFDEDFHGWGLEDIELGYRLFRRAVRLTVSRDAWAVDCPHERTGQVEAQSVLRNAELFLDKHPEPIPELLWARYAYTPRASVEDICREFTQWSVDSRDLDTAAEIAAAWPPERQCQARPNRIAVIGGGAGVPEWWPASTLVDFDSDLVAAVEPTDRHTAVHAIGLRTPFPDGSFDLVLITSRLRGLWERWGNALLAEASRLGDDVRVLFLED